MKNISNIEMSNLTKSNVYLAAIQPYIERNMVSADERYLCGQNRVIWGEGDKYPEYLFDLYRKVPTLSSIVDGTRDFVAGDDITILPLGDSFVDGMMNSKGDTIYEQVRECALSDLLYGGYAIQVVRSATGAIVELYSVDLRNLRWNADCNVFYYSENWTGKKPGKKNIITLPEFIPGLELKWDTLTPEERERHYSSIILCKADKLQTYPSPQYASAIVACEIEKNVGEYHLNAVDNSFAGSVVMNFNNGMPTDAVKAEIEKSVNEKFAGHSNAGRILCSYNEDKDHSLTIETPKIEDFGERYESLSKYSRQSIFTAFRAVPALFGLMTETTGFSKQEFADAFELYNKTRVRPIQRRISDTYDKIYGMKGVMSIAPFNLKSNDLIVK